MHITDKEAAVGRRSLELIHPQGVISPQWFHRRFPGQDTVYVRFYRMWEQDWAWPPMGDHDTYLFAGRYDNPVNTDLTLYLATMNSAPDEKDGEVRLWVDGELVTEMTGLVLRNSEQRGIQWDHWTFGPRYGEYGADVWRSDNTRGAVVSNNYCAVKGFYDMLDGLKQEMPRFQWENCSGGGPIKDYGAMKRAIRIQLTDEHTTLATRVTFYDSSYALHPMQLMTIVGYARCRTRPGEPGGLVYDFRSMALGAMQWYLDSPTPTNDGKPWTEEERTAIAREVRTYKTRLRPLIRQADLYHILPRPDNRNWDGIQYYDRRNSPLFGISLSLCPKSTTCFVSSSIRTVTEPPEAIVAALPFTVTALSVRIF